MTNNVISLEEKRAKRNSQAGYGEAFCIQCGHEWEAITDTGTVQLECPNCHTMKGLFKFPFEPNEGQLVRECGCGNQLFYLSPEGHLCANCGIYQRYQDKD